MAFNDAALERALRAETKGGLTLCGGVSELTVIGCGWMAVIPEIELRDRLRGTLGALVEMLGYEPVVHCKDCKHKDTWQESKIRDWFWCGVSGLQVVEDMDFCSYGERRTDEQ